jgi:D-alanyl-D-alanine carboxypeptidase/D-alanyl-D-alanine-endopeptidase (penicillin-binding protein 4)
MVLQHYEKHAGLLPEHHGAYAKSGTLRGVNNYAGYIETKQGMWPFVIILNQKRNTRDAVLRLLVDFCDS